ncbi:MAG: 4'-phosphopantetheinyl transferase superfamily protein [Planctomycetota bacterium]
MQFDPYINADHSGGRTSRIDFVGAGLPARTSNRKLEQEIARRLPDAIHSRILPAAEVDFDSPRQKRKSEFDAGRRLTAQLLARLDRQGPVGVADDRSPVWPNGVTGSISHSCHWLWSVVAENSDYLSVGIDTEPVVNSNTREQLIHEIADSYEWKIAAEAGLDAETTFTVVFSAKESLYKCLYPRSRQFFGFEQACVIGITRSSVRLELTPDNPNIEFAPDQIDIVYSLHGNDVFTATWLKA